MHLVIVPHLQSKEDGVGDAHEAHDSEGDREEVYGSSCPAWDHQLYSLGDTHISDLVIVLDYHVVLPLRKFLVDASPQLVFRNHCLVLYPLLEVLVLNIHPLLVLRTWTRLKDLGVLLIQILLVDVDLVTVGAVETVAVIKSEEGCI